MQANRGRKQQKAFNCLYSRYEEPITQYFFFSLRNDRQVAKDFCQDLFLKIFERPELFDASKVFKPWLYRVASNMVRNHYRRAEVKQKYTDFVIHTETDAFELNEQEQEIAVGLKQLKDEQRGILVMRFKLNMSIKEIADIFEIPEGTVKSRLFYATKELSKKVNPD